MPCPLIISACYSMSPSLYPGVRGEKPLTLPSKAPWHGAQLQLSPAACSKPSNIRRPEQAALVLVLGPR